MKSEKEAHYVVNKEGAASKLTLRHKAISMKTTRRRNENDENKNHES